MRYTAAFGTGEMQQLIQFLAKIKSTIVVSGEVSGTLTGPGTLIIEFNDMDLEVFNYIRKIKENE